MSGGSVFDSGERENLKLAVHASLGLLALLCAGYNMVALCRRREGHLAMNVLLYGGLVWLESRKCGHHCEGLAVETATHR